MRHDAHRVEQLAAEELEADDALVGIVRQIFLQQEQVVRQPDAGIAAKMASICVERVDHLDARAAAALVGLQERGPADLRSRRRASAATSLNVIERGQSMPSVRSSVACALLLNSSANTSAPLSTRAPSSSSDRMYASASGTARVLPRT